MSDDAGTSTPGFVILAILLLVGLCPYFVTGLMFFDRAIADFGGITLIYGLSYYVFVSTNVIPVLMISGAFAVYRLVVRAINDGHESSVSQNKLMLLAVAVIYLQLGSFAVLATGA